MEDFINLTEFQELTYKEQLAIIGRMALEFLFAVFIFASLFIGVIILC
jgi:hypothetical protein|tara:strand:+ start:433 stop:576 length:144 start_codon:yes stop_codon:yes gene_type:complete